MHHSHQAKQIQLIRPAAMCPHLDALEGIIVVHIVECLIRRKKFGVNGDTKVDQLQTELFGLCAQTVSEWKSAFSAYRICKDFPRSACVCAKKCLLKAYIRHDFSVCTH